MKGLITMLAILVAGIVSAQSFNFSGTQVEVSATSHASFYHTQQYRVVDGVRGDAVQGTAGVIELIPIRRLSSSSEDGTGYSWDGSYYYNDFTIAREHDGSGWIIFAPNASDDQYGFTSIASALEYAVNFDFVYTRTVLRQSTSNPLAFIGNDYEFTNGSQGDRVEATLQIFNVTETLGYENALELLGPEVTGYKFGDYVITFFNNNDIELIEGTDVNSLLSTTWLIHNVTTDVELDVAFFSLIRAMEYIINDIN